MKLPNALGKQRQNSTESLSSGMCNEAENGLSGDAGS